MLRKQNGVLIHIFQEGRGAGIFAKYLGMYTMQSQCVSTYGAYEKLNFEVDGRMYPLAFKILRDLGIKNIALLSNNPRKLKAIEEAGFSVVWEPLPGEITPQNFSYLFSKFAEGDHRIPILFPEEGEYYFCKTPSALGPFNRTWVFDGDDTLWEDNIAYAKIVDAFIEHCRPYLKNTTEEQVRQLIDETEEKTIQEIGFGAYGFLKSLETVYKTLTTEADIPRPTKLFESIVPTLKNQPEALVPDVVKILTELEKRGDGLVLYTQGPLGIQFEKVARSNLAEHFHALCVVKSKSTTSLQKLKGDLPFSSGEIIVVGNSLRSDIEPALEAGVKAVHFKNPNSWHVQNISDLDESKYASVSELKEVLKLDI
ncbi:HAD hydrolase-like protein [Patescibacteria group bacterium]|nr:HAD hydrolase-like protein [Patescibacteria group bacterium]